ncbi:MAG: phosphomannomutase/phosphoglucomutase, partial [Candidatus Coproplasma sp.]
KTLSSMIDALKLPVEEDEVRLKFTAESVDFKSEGDKVIEDLKVIALSSPDMVLAPDNYEGVRVNFGKDDGDGWFLVRMSVHDPVMPINFESCSVGGNVKIARRLYGLLKEYPFLDVNNLKNFIKE